MHHSDQLNMSIDTALDITHSRRSMSPIKRAAAAALTIVAAMSLASCSTTSAVEQAAEKDEVVAVAWASVQARLAGETDVNSCVEMEYRTSDVKIDEAVEPVVEKNDSGAANAGDRWNVYFAKKTETEPTVTPDPLVDGSGRYDYWASMTVERNDEGTVCTSSVYGLEG